MTKIVALLPIKAHSERIPEKNFRDFASQPLHTYIIESLLQTKSISQIFINTDSPIIMDAYTGKEKIFIIDRPKHLQGDSVSMNLIINDTLQHIKEEHILQTHVTNPLLKSETIDKAIDAYFKALEEGYDSLFSVTKQQKRFFDIDGTPVNHDPNKLINTQDLEPLYEENSNLYIFSKNSFAKNSNRLGLKSKMYPMDPLEAIDIDDIDDFTLAELLFKASLD